MNKPKIVLGTWAWGNDGVFSKSHTSQDLKKVFEEGLKNNFTMWDTSYNYGTDGDSEKFLGNFLRGKKREKLFVSDKVTPYVLKRDQISVEEYLNRSLDNLDTDYLDIYWVHMPEDVDKILPQLEPLYKRGLIKSIGLSNFDLDQLVYAQEVLAKHGMKVSAVQNHYSMLNRSSEKSGLLKYCKDNNIDFWGYMTLEQGALTGKYNRKNRFARGTVGDHIGLNRHIKEIEDLNVSIKEVADAHKVSQSAVVTAWVMSKGITPIVGVTKVSHVQDAKVASQLKLTPEELKFLDKATEKIRFTSVGGWEHKMLPSRNPDILKKINKPEPSKTTQNKQEQGKNAENKTAQSKPAQEKTNKAVQVQVIEPQVITVQKNPEQGKTAQNKQTQGKPEQGKPAQNKQSQGKAEQGKPEQNKQTQGKPEQNKHSKNPDKEENMSDMKKELKLLILNMSKDYANRTYENEVKNQETYTKIVRKIVDYKIKHSNRDISKIDKMMEIRRVDAAASALLVASRELYFRKKNYGDEGEKLVEEIKNCVEQLNDALNSEIEAYKEDAEIKTNKSTKKNVKIKEPEDEER